MADALVNFDGYGFTADDLVYAFHWADMAFARDGWGITEQGNRLLVFKMTEGYGVSYEVTALADGFALKQIRLESRTGRSLTRTFLADSVEEALDKVSRLETIAASTSEAAALSAAFD